MVYDGKKTDLVSTTIESRKFRIPSDLRRQPGYRPVSSKVGDHLRILLGVVVQILFVFGPVQRREFHQAMADFMLKGMLVYALNGMCECVSGPLCPLARLRVPPESARSQPWFQLKLVVKFHLYSFTQR